MGVIESHTIEMIFRDPNPVLRSLVAVLAALLTTGCATSGKYKALAELVAASTGPTAVVERMQAGKRLDLGDVSALSRAGVSDELILAYLKRQRSVYLLQDREVAHLQQSGVSQPVIDYLAATPKKLNPRLYPKGYVPCDVCRPAYVRRYGR